MAALPLIDEIRACRLCESELPHGVRPVVQFSPHSKVVIVGQAPGIRVHRSGVPWDDASGDRLRQWLEVSTEDFYDTAKFGIVPMGFCYPGTGKSGDLPPRPECAEKWMTPVMNTFEAKPLVLLIGAYAQKYFLKARRQRTLTDTVHSFREYLPEYFVLPHPSPRNNIWLKKNEWFEGDILPSLRQHVQKRLTQSI